MRVPTKIEGHMCVCVCVAGSIPSLGRVLGSCQVLARARFWFHRVSHEIRSVLLVQPKSKWRRRPRCGTLAPRVLWIPPSRRLRRAPLRACEHTHAQRCRGDTLTPAGAQSSCNPSSPCWDPLRCYGWGPVSIT